VMNDITKYDLTMQNGKAVLPPYSVAVVKYAQLMQIYEADFAGKSVRIDGTLGAEAKNENITLTCVIQTVLTTSRKLKLSPKNQLKINPKLSPTN
ncbi:MAG: hypothetical protein PUE13_08660, partial [Clostridiales bacterium]|nr:hypothetical protein [Clostridiales bacterium]